MNQSWVQMGTSISISRCFLGQNPTALSRWNFARLSGVFTWICSPIPQTGHGMNSLSAKPGSDGKVGFLAAFTSSGVIPFLPLLIPMPFEQGVGLHNFAQFNKIISDWRSLMASSSARRARMRRRTASLSGRSAEPLIMTPRSSRSYRNAGPTASARRRRENPPSGRPDR